jgi:hypothetical protein
LALLAERGTPAWELGSVGAAGVGAGSVGTAGAGGGAVRMVGEQAAARD